jgi:hypothetical protein
MADKSTLGYLPETSQEAIEANRAYQEALARLNESLDVRKNRLMDPRWAAAAQGFFAPTRTGGWGEALGNVIGNVSKADEAMALEEQNIAKVTADLAAQGLGMVRQCQRDKMYDEAMGGKPTASQGALAAASIKPPEGGSPTGPLIAYGAPKTSEPNLPEGALPAGPSGGPMEPARVQGAEPFGIRIAPPSTGQISREQFLAGERLKGTPLSEALAKWEEIERKRTDIEEAGMFRDGMFYPAATGTQVEVQNIPLPGGGYGTFKTDSVTAAMLADARRNGDIAKELAIIKRIVSRPSFEAEAPQGAPPSIEEQERAKAEAAAYAKKRGDTAAEKETELTQRADAAGRIYSASTRVSEGLGKSGKYFGIFERLGMIAAIGSLVSRGVQTPGGTLNLGGFEDSIRKLMPGIKQADLDNVTRAAADLAEIELAYTQLYLTKQGAITEGEREIVRRLGGNVSNSPGVLQSRMEILRARSQYDLNKSDLFNKWQDANPGKTIFDFERTQPAKDLKETFERETAKIAGGLPALPSSRKAPAKASAKDGRTPAQRIDDILGGK